MRTAIRAGLQSRRARSSTTSVARWRNPAGSARPGAVYDPDLLRGWDKRTANWEFSAGVQRELFARTSVDVAYFRRTYPG